MEALGTVNQGSDNTALGDRAGDNLELGSNNVYIANPGSARESGTIQIGTLGHQTTAFLQGVSGTAIPGPTQAVRVNAAGQLGTATAAFGKTSTAKPLSATVGRLAATVKRQQRQIDRLRSQVRRGG